ncbi:glutamate--cysteine ligase [Amycolatopsis arida]|uniref:Glutamate--cysteine ligase EgtA n=1 Tax=Amycolatopsis arida TaxID=587909 RepID=A0A1I5ZPA9_9PSEU|nr:ergothioneine biosynthesis glutamate--cysteine ligase EgtA [Amycolatopsis arida]TDX89243.1 glutamate--cysteine ligase [Amycolatopsis arida]SFQ58173.1 glutamate--cysteine ligase [Amycolatopsis arida]
MTAVHERHPRSPFHTAASSAEADQAAVNRTARILADRAEGEAYVASVCFRNGPPRRIGVELEYTVHRTADPTRPLDPADLVAALGPHAPRTVAPDSPAEPLPHGSPVTLEPGGQIEISPPPQTSLGALAAVADADLAHLRERLAAVGLSLGTSGIDPHRPPARMLATPRYTAMERRFAPEGPGGITMMCSTAALQVCVDVGERATLPGRWALVHALGPVLVALFANSARHAGVDTGCASARWLAVLRTERCRTHPSTPSRDPVTDWARRLMDTPVMVLRRRDGPWDAPPGLTFADWIAGRGAGARLDPPTTADLDYHLSTMFTPVRPRGYLEIRYLDAQPPGRWLPPVALLTALLARPATVDRALAACAPVADRWEDAARHGLTDARLAAAGRAVVDLGCAELAELGTGTGLPAATVMTIIDDLQRRLDHGGEEERR